MVGRAWRTQLRLAVPAAAIGAIAPFFACSAPPMPGPDPGQTMSTFVAYSLVPTKGVDTRVIHNYAIAGRRPGDVGIEFAGSGEIVDNFTDGFKYGAIVYGAGFSVHDNNFVGATIAPVLNDGKYRGTIVANTVNPPAKPFPRPTRRPWP